MELLGHSTANISGELINIAHSDDGSSIYVAAPMGDDAVSIELDSLSGEVLNTSIVE